MATNINTSLTALGYKTLMKTGLVSEIKFYGVNDNFHDYLVSAPENLVPGVTGSHSQITTSYSDFAQYNGVLNEKPTPAEVQQMTSKVQYSFVNEDCSYGNFNQPNLNIVVNVNTWLNQLSTATYDFNMEGLTLELWDYLTATIQTLNLSTKNYDNTKFLTSMNINWVPKTDFDLNNLFKLSPRYVTIENGGDRRMVDNSDVQYGSPFFLSFSSYPVNGTIVNNTACRLSLVPNEFGYWVNGNTFLNTSTVENNDLNIYTTVQPAARVGKNIYVLNESTIWPTRVGFIGYALKMLNVNGSGETLLTGLINQAKLFLKTYTINNGGVYNLPINIGVVATNTEINSINDKFGGNVTINISYNPSDITTPAIQYL